MTLPGPKVTRDLFEGMLGREVLLADAAPVPIDATPRPVIATYLDDAGGLGTIVVLDFALAARVGAAFGLVPSSGADLAIAERDLPPSLLENTAELLNVLASPIGDASGIHQRLVETYGPAQLPPAHVSVWAATLGARADYRLDVAGYGSGGVSIVSARP